MTLKELIRDTNSRRLGQKILVNQGVKRPRGEKEWRDWSEALGRFSELDRMVHELKLAEIKAEEAQTLAVLDAKIEARRAS